MSQATDPKDAVTFYGFTPVVRDPDVLFKDHPTASPNNPNPQQDYYTVQDFLPLPGEDSELVKSIREFVKASSLVMGRE